MAGSTPVSDPVIYGQNRLTADDLYLFNEGSHFRLYDKLGAKLMTVDGIEGVHFAVWAPDAFEVFVIGDFNGWDKSSHRLRPSGRAGIWEGFIPGIGRGTCYKYHIVSKYNGYRVDKADPFGSFHEHPPRTGSVVWDLAYEWNDSEWMSIRGDSQHSKSPISIYEMHMGSWMRKPEEDNRRLNYREIAPLLADHIKSLNFTHVEFLPIMEHPFYGSWGYQATGFFAPTSRFGTPQDFMYLVDYLHQNGIGVILDWVPSHFPKDEHGLGYFDGTHLFEHADQRQGLHPDWDSLIFNYSRNEVRSFLISSALFWLDKYHIDGLRVDAVASMLYLDYSRKQGEWIPNKYGGRENLEAIDFIRRFNVEVYQNHPDVITVAEESTAWPMVSRPTYVGGLGFGMKWDMGWMHDTLEYISKDPIHRTYHHNNLTFRSMYSGSENFVLPLSHDEVVHGKGSLLGKMPGDPWQKFANLRLLYAYMYCQPGKKLLFMGAEIGQWAEWNHDTSLEWHLLEYPPHQGLRRFVEDLNRMYQDQPALYQRDFEWNGFEWIDCNDAISSTLSMIRLGDSPEDTLIAAFNFTPVPRENYRLGAPEGGYWAEIFNSDAEIYGGSGWGNFGGQTAESYSVHGRPYTLTITLPPLAAVFFKRT
jgi:1,4-alpha-glucan branching enzyme